LAGKDEKKKKAVKKANPISRFVRETVGELRKVSWPTRQEAINLTIIVIIVMVATAIFLYVVDAGAAWLLTKAIGI
jgi:preprotein translocase subunit SecE